ncbi:ATP-binding protein [Tropicimonas sp.]|uniref:ATP-binding protein n=1 Tax=Tropicimonas sp. TaxID=2067044 RepID=UPI003A8572FF
MARKWRPPLWLLIAALVCLLLSLPLAGLGIARLADDQFVRETERSLISQSAVLAEVYAGALDLADPALGAALPVSPAAGERDAETFHPIEPVLSLTGSEIAEPAPEGRVAPHPPAAAYLQVARHLSALAQRSQKTTLAGYRFTDASGQVIASSGAGIGTSLRHLPEIETALSGRVASSLRYREPLEERHTLDSISRDTTFRVTVAHPVFLNGRIAGVVVVSRTPDGLRKFLYRERHYLGRIFALTAGAALLIGFVFWRAISSPIRALRTQSQEVASGRRPAPEPLAHYGVRELAELGQSVLSMAGTLSERSEAIGTYTQHVTHELKSPVTTIVGAAELLETAGDRLDPARRARLLAQIGAEGHRMDRLLSRLRELARVRTFSGEETTDLAGAVSLLAPRFPALDIRVAAPGGWQAGLSADELEIVLTQLLQNAAEHGAGRVDLAADAGARILSVGDDGAGIPPGQRNRVFDPFYTTRRAEGGTGMGLAIVAAIIERRRGHVRVGDVASGTEIRLFLPGSHPAPAESS